MSELTQLPGELNIETYKNDTLERTLTFVDESNVALDLSNCTVVLQVRRKAGEDVELELTEADGLTVTGNDVEILKVIDLDKGRYKYDMQFTYDSGIVRTYVAGEFVVNDDITR